MSNFSLQEIYRQKICPKLKKEFKLKSYLAVPNIKKVVVNIGIGDIAKDKKSLNKVINYLTALTGQKPTVRVAKKSIAEFKTRVGSPIGLKVTLRKRRAFSFLSKLFNIVLPRVRDFSGLSLAAFDGRGNYNLGLREQIIFPEVDYDKIDKIRGLEITIVTSCEEDKKAKRLLEELGMPFERSGHG